MWGVLSIASLLMRAIVAKPEVQNIRDSNRSRLDNDTDGIHRNGIRVFTIPRTWDDIVQRNENRYRQLPGARHIAIPLINDEQSHINDEARNRNSRAVGEFGTGITNAKKGEGHIATSWLYSPSKERILPDDERHNLSEEKKSSSSFDSWGGKRLALPNAGPTIRRPIRVPFRTWGGKRGSVFAKGDIFIYDSFDRGVSVGRVGSKRFAASGRHSGAVPFVTWGGKRSWFDDLDLDLDLDLHSSFLDGETSRSSRDDRGRTERIGGEQYARVKESKARTTFNSWAGKRGAVYRSTGNANVDRFNGAAHENRRGWFEPPNKRGGQQRLVGVTWTGKRSTTNEASFLARDYFAGQADSERRDNFYPWGG